MTSVGSVSSVHAENATAVASSHRTGRLDIVHLP
jgi:hypothetical protein